MTTKGAADARRLAIRTAVGAANSEMNGCFLIAIDRTGVLKRREDLAARLKRTRESVEAALRVVEGEG